MDFSTIDSWTVVVSESQPSSIEKLGNLIDFGNPPAFFDFADRQWQRRGDGDASGWDLLMDGQFILRAVGHPGVLSLKQALILMGYALQVDTLFDTKLLRRLLAQRLWPEEVPSDEVMRTLEVLETLDEPQRLSMTLLKFSKFPDRRVQSKVAKILGRCIDSVEVMDELFSNPDGRVRANLIEGISRRNSVEILLPLIERATRDQHTRVSSLALALRARTGHSGASALIKMRANSKMNDIRKSAEAAQRIASGGKTPLDPIEPLAGNVDPLGVVDGQPAVAPAVEEVHS
jgi:hypothetical protein